ncbi:Transcriptional regulator ModE [compost metagenome]
MEITTDAKRASGADNQLPGIISNIQQGAEQSEVLVQLPDGQTLCATMPNTVVEIQKLVEGAEVIAFFNADRVIIATLC